MAKMILDIPANVRKDFKIECMKKGTTMKEELTSFMKFYIKTHSKKNNQVKK